MLVRVSNGFIILAIDGRQVTIYGERLNSAPGNSNFVASVSRLKKWLDGSPVADYEKKIITETLINDFKEKGWTIEIE
jgi:hypothetical protein